MQINKVRIINYKSFLDSGELIFKPGFNVIVGENNAGKTALVEAIHLRLENNPHRSLATVRAPEIVLPASESQVNISFYFNHDEFINFLKDRVPIFNISAFPGISEQENVREFIRAISKECILECEFKNSNFISTKLATYDPQVSKPRSFLRFKIDFFDTEPQFNGTYSGTFESLESRLANTIREQIYLFKAERFKVGQCVFGTNSTLNPDASNLPEVLNILQSQASRFRLYNQAVTEIFPEITQVAISPIPNNQVKIFIHTVDTDLQRDDLGIPLQDSGTGISQVLAILYVVMNSTPRPIIIDEPQSFLHPGALRKLLDVLGRHRQHQYIITTHSPLVVSSVVPENLLMVRKSETISNIKALNAKSTRDLHTVLASVGARISDVFGADSILWVEGRTEEQCYPHILTKLLEQPLAGTVILGVLQTGDLKGKDKRRVFEIYQRLSQGRGLLPPAVGFIFDQEGLSAADQEDLIREGRITIEGPSLMRFIPRRMYENYLLNPKAIANVISTIDGFRDTPVTENEIEEWLKAHQWDKEYFKPMPSEAERTDESWREKVDGAKLLDRMFNELSETRVSYESNKAEYGLALTNWLIENAPEELDEIASLLKDALSQKAKEGQAG